MKLGIVLATLYFLISLGSGLHALTCDGSLCGLMYLVPLTPWVQLFEGLLDIDLPWPTLALGYLLNATIFYALGYWLERVGKSILRR